MHPKTLGQIAMQFFLAMFLFFNTLLVIPISAIFFLLLRSLVVVLAKIFRKDLKHPLRMLSTLWASGEEVSKIPKINVCLFFVYDGHMDIQQLQCMCQERLIQKLNSNGELMYSELKMYWVSFLNYLFWKEDENFDLKNHVRIYDYGGKKEDADLYLPTDGTCDEKDLGRILGSLLSKPYGAKRSPWEILLLHNFKSQRYLSRDENKCSLLIFRQHHAMLDGYGETKFILRDLMHNTLKIRVNFPKMDAWEKARFYTSLPVKMPWDMAGSLMNSFDGGHCWNTWGQKGKKLSGELVACFSNPIDVGRIKRIKNKYGVSFNDVSCTVTANACKRLMEEAGQEVPEEITCSSPYPLKNHPDGLVNHMTFNIFKWPMGKNVSKEERLRIISKRLTPSKFYTSPLGYHLLARYCNLLPSSLIGMMKKFPFTFSLTIFSYPQGQYEFTGAGVKLIEIMGCVGPGDGTVGTAAALLSYNGCQRTVAYIDRIYFPKPELFQRFGQYMEDELEAMMGDIENNNKL